MMNNFSNDISYNEMKDIAYTICDNVCKEEKIDVKIDPVTFVEYYKSDVFRKNIKLAPLNHKMRWIKTPFFCKGISLNEDKEVMIFLNNFNKMYKINKDFKLVDFVFVIYHELRHAIQEQKLYIMDNNPKLDINKFSIVLDFCRSLDVVDYRKHHDEYMIEIDADMYALKKTKAFFKNSKEFYLDNMEYFDLMDCYNKFRNSNYDIQLSIDSLNKLLKDKNNLFLLDDYYVLRLFYEGNDVRFKKISHFINDPAINSFDYRIMANMVSSKDFLKNINFSNLSSDELYYILSCIYYVLNDYLDRKKISDNILISFNEMKFSSSYIETKKRLLYNNIKKSKKNEDYYSFLRKILAEYNFHGKIVEGGKIL